jgi:ACS family D-galactonate transporter-like MFS transporter
MPAEQLRPSRLQWLALALLVISVCINYVDRGNLGVAAKSIEADLHFPPEQLGLLLGSIFWTYSLGQLVAGKLIDRWNVNWVYAAGFLIWSAATGLTGLANSFVAFFLLRLVLGAGESIAYPSYSKIIATGFPEQLRGTANALIDCGSKVGPALGVMLGVKMINALSWRYMFVAIGGASLLWLLPWCLLIPKLPLRRVIHASQWSPPYLSLIKERRVWGTVLGLFGGNYTWYFFLTWLPYYFESERHYTKDRLAFFASLPFWSVSIASMLFGLAADALIRRGYNAGRVRQAFVSLGLLGCCIFMVPAILVTEDWLCNTFFALASVCMAGFSSNHWAFSQTLAGPEAAGKWTGFENCLGNFAGVIAPWITGLALRETHSFLVAVMVACGVLLLGVLGFSFVVGTPNQVVWHRDPLALDTENVPESVEN